MSTIAQRFQTFLSNLQLSDAQVQDAIRKHTAIRRLLHNHYYSTSFVKSISDSEEIEVIAETIRGYKGYEVLLDESARYRTSLLVGSYGKNTEIAPPSDVDVLFEMPSQLFNHYDTRLYNGQSKLLQDVKNVLRPSYPLTDIRADGQIVYVPFVSYKIEVLPAFKRSTGDYFYPDTHNGGTWCVTHPKAEKQNLVDSNKRSNGNTIRLIKMMKAWKSWCTVPIKSLALELLTVSFLSAWEHYDKGPIYFDWMVRDFLAYVLKHINWTIPIPGISEVLVLGDAWKSKAETALATAYKACEYEAAKNDLQAAYEWKKIFGDRYYF